MPNVVKNVVDQFPIWRPPVSLKMKKSLKTIGFQGLLRGGDKRDRTALVIHFTSFRQILMQQETGLLSGRLVSFICMRYSIRAPW